MAFARQVTMEVIKMKQLVSNEKICPIDWSKTLSMLRLTLVLALTEIALAVKVLRNLLKKL